MADLTVEGIERIARDAIRERLRNADAEHAILDVSPGGPPNTVLLHVNSGGNAIAAETALTAAGYLVDSRPAEHGVVLGVALRSFDFASLRYAQNMRAAGLETTVEQITPGQTRVSGREPHVLIVTSDPQDPENLTYDVECPGVNDECRKYLDCLAGETEQAALEHAADDGEPLVAHGKRHLKIDGTWMSETDDCFVAGHDGLPDAVDGRFTAGRHPIGWDVGDGTEIEIYALAAYR